MDTWKVAKWMSESVKTVFSAVTDGPSDAVKVGEKTYTKKPATNCNSKHEVQLFRTIADKAGKKSHALTDHMIIDFRGRDTDDWVWVGISWDNANGYDESPNNKYGNKHAVKIKIEHDGETAYEWEQYGTPEGNGWVSSKHYLITKPGKWTAYSKYLSAHTCGKVGDGDGWRKIGSFTAQEPLDDCYFKGREEGANVGDCGDCLTGYTEVDGECQADSSSSGDGASGGGSFGTMDNSQIYMIGGGVLLLALLLKRKK